MCHTTNSPTSATSSSSTSSRPTMLLRHTTRDGSPYFSLSALSFSVLRSLTTRPLAVAIPVTFCEPCGCTSCLPLPLLLFPSVESASGLSMPCEVAPRPWPFDQPYLAIRFLAKSCGLLVLSSDGQSAAVRKFAVHDETERHGLTKLPWLQPQRLKRVQVGSLHYHCQGSV